MAAAYGDGGKDYTNATFCDEPPRVSADLILEGKKGPNRHPGATAATASIRGTKKSERLIRN